MGWWTMIWWELLILWIILSYILNAFLLGILGVLLKITNLYENDTTQLGLWLFISSPIGFPFIVGALVGKLVAMVIAEDVVDKCH